MPEKRKLVVFTSEILNILDEQSQFLKLYFMNSSVSL